MRIVEPGGDNHSTVLLIEPKQTTESQERAIEWRAVLVTSCRFDRNRVIAGVSRVVVISLWMFLGTACQKAPTPPPPRTGAFSDVLAGPELTPQYLSPHITYDLIPGNERYFMYVPSGYTRAESYGLIVFTSADPSAGLPIKWRTILDARKYIFVAAENAGNDQPRQRRLALAVVGALKMMRAYHIDPSRVYAAGFSGGARMAGLLAFYQSDIFRGTLQNCGADFYRPVPAVDATLQVDTAGKPYGVLIEASDDEIRRAKKSRFALITGTNDFRRGNILDIFHGGFEQDGFQAKLFDIVGMGHDICDGETLSRALDFLEKGS
jgi:hypothetical protein